MEQTTSEVVRGANLSKDAGVALDEIQTVSTNLAKLILTFRMLQNFSLLLQVTLQPR